VIHGEENIFSMERGGEESGEGAFNLCVNHLNKCIRYCHHCQKSNEKNRRQCALDFFSDCNTPAEANVPCANINHSS